MLEKTGTIKDEQRHFWRKALLALLRISLGVVIGMIMLLLVFGLLGWAVPSSWGLSPRQEGELVGSLIWFIVAWSWLGLWIWSLLVQWRREARAGRLQLEGGEEERLTPNFVPLIALVAGAAVLGVGRRYYYGGGELDLPLAVLVMLSLVISLWRHSFEGDWVTPLVALPAGLWAGYILVNTLGEVTNWQVNLGSWDWLGPWVPSLMASILLVEPLRGVLNRWMSARWSPGRGQE